MGYHDYVMQRNYLAPLGRYENWLETETRVKDEREKQEKIKAQQAEAQAAVEPSKRYRILRFIEYTGSLEWVNDCIAKRGVKGTKELGGKGDNVIREGILGDAPELLQHPQIAEFKDISQRLKNLHKDLLNGRITQLETTRRAGDIQCDLDIAIKRFGAR